ncbi:DUF4148 domain-containing protein [Burkholderia ambifaria]|uniref:DUF4148 domain-containing protein n=1 Tax=Burkholderia ambifaria TaxID=152480 RepID=UPI0002DBB1E9|nr:DUF4148 domain-containing protein [Burkholderia ambifaria]
MKYFIGTIVFAVALTLGTVAHAAPKLTAAQCTDYPFVRGKGPVTHQQLLNELSELESVGYEPSAGDKGDYPDDIDTAQQKLMQLYRRDCVDLRATTAAHRHKTDDR